MRIQWSKLKLNQRLEPKSDQSLDKNLEHSSKPIEPQEDSQPTSFQEVKQFLQRNLVLSIFMMVKWPMTGIKITDPHITQELMLMTVISFNLMLRMMVKWLFKMLESKQLKCKLKWTRLSQVLIRGEQNNKLHMSKTFQTTTQLPNWRDSWMLNKVSIDSLLDSAQSQTWKKLTVWHKSLVSQWPQSWCNSVPMKQSQML